MNIYVEKVVLANLASWPKHYTAGRFPSLTKHRFFAMLKETKGNP